MIINGAVGIDSKMLSGFNGINVSSDKKKFPAVAIFLTLNPMLAGLWLTLVRGTKMSSVECICAVLAAAGVALMVTDGDFSGLKFSPMAVVWGLCSAVFATAFSIQPQKPSAKAGVTVVVAWAFLLSSARPGRLM